jgi:hypothetical protein
MTIGAGLLLIALGAILKFAVTATVSGVNLATTGVVLMVVGVVGLILGLVLMTRRRRTDVVQTNDVPGGPVRRTTYVQDDPQDPRY